MNPVVRIDIAIVHHDEVAQKAGGNIKQRAPTKGNMVT